MNIIHKRVAIVVLAALSVGIISNAKSESAKADVTNISRQSIVVKSTSFSTGKVLTVPDRTAERKQATKQIAIKQVAKTASFSRGETSSVSVNSSYNDTLDVSGSGGKVVSYAFRFMGAPYVWGASGPSAFDCSGFTAYVYGALGQALPHFTGSQAQMGQSISKGSLRAGDLIFFNTYSSISHVGIYIGGGQFIHASSGSHRITVSNLSESYYDSRYACARRIFQ